MKEPKVSKKRTLVAINTSYLRRAIKNEELTQKELANMAGLTPEMIHRYVHGKSKCSPRNLIRIANALKVDSRSLLEPDDVRSQNYLRDILNKKIEHDRKFEDDIPLVDIPTFIQIMKSLGYDKKSSVKINVADLKEEIPELESEMQMKNLIGGDDNGEK